MLPAELRTDNPQFHLFVKGILAWPFSIKLRVLEFCAVGKEEEVVSLLEKVKVQRIQEVFLVERVPFTVLSACVDKYKVQELLIGGDAEYNEVEMEALLRKPLRHVEMPEIPYELFVDTNIPKLRIPGADVTTAGLSAIFKRFLDGDGLIDWRMEHEMSPRDLDNCLGDYLQLNANYSGALPPQRPLAVYSFGEDEGDKIYHVLREDGRIIHVSNFFVDDFGDSTRFKVKQCPLSDAPPILSR